MLAGIISVARWLRRAGIEPAIALFGFQSGAALASVVGVLVEVPVMLSVVPLVRRAQTRVADSA